MFAAVVIYSVVDSFGLLVAVRDRFLLVSCRDMAGPVGFLILFRFILYIRGKDD